MLERKKDSVEDLFQTLLGILAAVITIYGFLYQTPAKFAIIGLGIILLYFYTRSWIKDFIARDILIQNEKIDKVEENYRNIEKEVIYMKGWMEAINHFKSKKGRGAIDPLTLIIAIAIIILVVAYLQGRLP